MPLRDDSSSIPEVISVRKSVASLANFAKDAAASITAVPRKSPFQEWNREELEMILIDQNIQIRKSGDVLRDYLVRLCDDVFEGVPVPDKPSTQYSPEKYRQMQHAALVIQGLVLRSMKKDIKDVSMISHDSKMGDCFFPDLSAGLSGSRNDIGTDDISIKICEARVRDSTEIEWRKPSWKSAKRYGFDNQPNPKGPGSTFNWRSITLGRHCIRGGCGEQLDLWDEGQTSEFAQFGSGVTNYFKVSNNG